MRINQYWQSADLALVTTISLWYPIEAIDRSNPSKAVFLFKRDEQLDQLLESYWKKELKVVFEVVIVTFIRLLTSASEASIPSSLV